MIDIILGIVGVILIVLLIFILFAILGFGVGIVNLLICAVSQRNNKFNEWFKDILDGM